MIRTLWFPRIEQKEYKKHPWLNSYRLNPPLTYFPLQITTTQLLSSTAIMAEVQRRMDAGLVRSLRPLFRKWLIWPRAYSFPRRKVRHLANTLMLIGLPRGLSIGMVVRAISSRSKVRNQASMKMLIGPPRGLSLGMVVRAILLWSKVQTSELRLRTASRVCDNQSFFWWCSSFISDRYLRPNSSLFVVQCVDAFYSTPDCCINVPMWTFSWSFTQSLWDIPRTYSELMGPFHDRRFT